MSPRGKQKSHSSLTFESQQVQERGMPIAISLYMPDERILQDSSPSDARCAHYLTILTVKRRTSTVRPCPSGKAMVNTTDLYFALLRATTAAR